METIVVKDGEEEGGVRRYQPGVDVVHEDGEKLLPASSGTAMATRSVVSPHSFSSLAIRRSIVWSFSPVTQGAISSGSYQAAPAAKEEAVAFSAAIRQKIWWIIGRTGELFCCGERGIWSKTKKEQ